MARVNMTKNKGRNEMNNDTRRLINLALTQAQGGQDLAASHTLRAAVKHLEMIHAKAHGAVTVHRLNKGGWIVVRVVWAPGDPEAQDTPATGRKQLWRIVAREPGAYDKAAAARLDAMRLAREICTVHLIIDESQIYEI